MSSQILEIAGFCFKERIRRLKEDKWEKKIWLLQKPIDIEELKQESLLDLSKISTSLSILRERESKNLSEEIWRE